jgi:hypothetical protein
MILTVADVKLYCGESHGYPNRSFELFFCFLDSLEAMVVKNQKKFEEEANFGLY